MMDWYHGLSKREQKLVLWVSLLLPLALIAYFTFSFIDSYSKNSLELAALKSQITEQEEKTHQGILAGRRQAYYRAASLPSRPSAAKNVYKDWLTTAVRDSGMEYPGVSLSNSDRIEFEGNLVGYSTPFTLRPTATLPQLIAFLTKFYSADHLHRISELTIKPIRKKASGGKTVLTGELKLTMKIHVLSLFDGPDKVDTFPMYTNPPGPPEQFDQILARNVFGPANNVPSLGNPSKTKFYVDEDGLVTLSATDLDKDDVLSFELVKSDVQSAHLSEQPKSASVRNITLTIPAQEPGKYSFTVEVRDDGMPAKVNEKTFVIEFSKRPPPTIVKKDPPEPEIKLVEATYVHGLMQGTDGQWKALVVVHPDNNRAMRVKAGDKFELDDEKFIVKSVDEKSLTLEVGGKTLIFEHGSRLSEPVNKL